MSHADGFSAQLLGGYSGIYAIATLVNRPMLTDALNALLYDASQVFISGSLCAVAGLAFVVGHNRWSGSPLTIVVTVIGGSRCSKASGSLPALVDGLRIPRVLR